jgi:hypothetical protein
MGQFWHQTAAGPVSVPRLSGCVPRLSDIVAAEQVGSGLGRGACA